MRRAGVRSVRTELVQDTLLLAAADLLGIAFYQDLPFANLPAATLANRLGEAERLLSEALERGAGYSAARHFGLARYSDTSDPRVRRYFERLTALAHARDTQTYYLTRFPDNDRAAHTVDFVLLDARDADPVALLARWRAQHEEPAGIGAFGAAVQPGREGGWRIPRTAAAQARALENGLAALLDVRVPPVAFFVHNWRDTDAAADGRAEVQGAAYGLLDSAGAPRPAFHVVKGFYTGVQRVFAFDAGETVPEARTVEPLVLLGWSIVLTLALLYGLAPRFGALGRRYFTRHDLYQESIQRGYDVHAGLSGALALILAGGAGVVAAAALRALGRTDALATATSAWTLEAQARLIGLLGEPLLLAGAVAVGYSAWILFNMIWLFVVAGRRRRVRPQQALTLVVWSRWTLLVLMVAAMLVATMPIRYATTAAPVLLVLWLGLELAATVRMLNDFGAVVHVPLHRSFGLGVVAPLGVLLAIVGGAFFFGRAELGFLWHLATRS